MKRIGRMLKSNTIQIEIEYGMKVTLLNYISKSIRKKMVLASIRQEVE